MKRICSVLVLLLGFVPPLCALGQGPRVYICVDMEGTSTVASAWDVVGGEGTAFDAEGKDFERNRHSLTAEVNAAIQGAREAGAREFLVKECHGGRAMR